MTVAVPLHLLLILSGIMAGMIVVTILVAVVYVQQVQFVRRLTDQIVMLRMAGAPSLAPSVRIVRRVPSDGFEGEVLFQTLDNRLYRWSVDHKKFMPADPGARA